VILDGTTRYDIAAVGVKKVTDTTGAGDQYAAGVLTGYLMDLGWVKSGQLGSLCAKMLAGQKGLKL